MSGSSTVQHTPARPHLAKLAGCCCTAAAAEALTLTTTARPGPLVIQALCPENFVFCSSIYTAQRYLVRVVLQVLQD